MELPASHTSVVRPLPGVVCTSLRHRTLHAKWHARRCVCVDPRDRLYRVALFPTHHGPYEYTAKWRAREDGEEHWAGGFGGNARVEVLPPLSLPLVANSPMELRRLCTWVLFFMERYGVQVAASLHRAGHTERHDGHPGAAASPALVSYVAGSMAFVLQRVVHCSDAAAIGFLDLLAAGSWRRSRANLTRTLGWLLGGPYVAKCVATELDRAGDVAVFVNRVHGARTPFPPPAALAHPPTPDAVMRPVTPPRLPPPKGRPAVVPPPRGSLLTGGASMNGGAAASSGAGMGAGAGSPSGINPFDFRPRASSPASPYNPRRLSLRVHTRTSPQSDNVGAVAGGAAACASALLALLDLACWCCEPESAFFFHDFGATSSKPSVGVASLDAAAPRLLGSLSPKASQVTHRAHTPPPNAPRAPSAGAVAPVPASPPRPPGEVTRGSVAAPPSGPPVRSPSSPASAATFGSRESAAIAASHSAETLRRSLSQSSLHRGAGATQIGQPSPMQPNSIPIELLLDMVQTCVPTDVSAAFIYQAVDNLSWARVRSTCISIACVAPGPVCCSAC